MRHYAFVEDDMSSASRTQPQTTGGLWVVENGWLGVVDLFVRHINVYSSAA